MSGHLLLPAFLVGAQAARVEDSGEVWRPEALGRGRPPGSVVECPLQTGRLEPKFQEKSQY